MTEGVLIVDKPQDITSHDVVARCRRLFGMRQIGHTGTLDPFATGVMAVLLGQATRLARFIDKDEKEYEATVRFGVRTDTGDLTGEVITDSKGKIPSEEEVRAALGQFVGER
ncbi:MAG: pseudouridine synthase, partial [Acidobacteriota bacterium]